MNLPEPKYSLSHVRGPIILSYMQTCAGILRTFRRYAQCALHHICIMLSKDQSRKSQRVQNDIPPAPSRSSTDSRLRRGLLALERIAETIRILVKRLLDAHVGQTTTMQERPHVLARQGPKKL